MARKITLRKTIVRPIRLKTTHVKLRRIDITLDLKKMVQRNRRLLVELSK